MHTARPQPKTVFDEIHCFQAIRLRRLEIMRTGARWLVNLIIPSEEPYD